MIKKAMLGVSVALLAVSGAAMASHHGPGHGDPMGDKTVTRAEAQTHAAAMFAKMDVNKDGKIDAGDREARRMARFDGADANKDGSVSRDEFTAARKAAGERRAEWKEKAKGERAERGEHGKRMGGHGRGKGMKGAMMMLAMADTNKDKAVSKDEFLAAHAKHFDTTDANKDGSLTPDERKAAQAKMREHMKSMRGKGAPTPPPAG